jgi:hypothetical protein
MSHPALSMKPDDDPPEVRFDVHAAEMIMLFA